MTDTELQTAVEPVEPSAPAPDTEIEGVKPTETDQATETPPTDAPNERYTKRMNQKHWEAQEAKREAAELQVEVTRLKAQLPQEQRPVIPELPDPYDADYPAMIQAHTEAVGKAATFDANQATQTEATNQANFKAQQKLQKEWVDRAQTYSERATELKIDPQQLQSAGAIVAGYRLNDDVTSYVMERKDGPVITTYLAAHQDQLDTVSRMSPTQASVYIETVISPKASASVGISGAPEPADSLSGGGAPPTQRGPKGATYT